MHEERVDIRVSLLGPVMALKDRRDVPLGAPMQRTVFAVLAAHANQVVSRDELVEAVWGDRAPNTAINSIYTYVARLRNSLEPQRGLKGRSELLVSDSAGYMLQLASGQVDRQQFETHITNARRLYGDDAIETAIGQLDAGLSLWRGSAYGVTTGPFAAADRARLDDLRLSAMADRLEMLQELGRDAGLDGELLGLVRRHPLHERLRFLLIRAYVEQGRHADAVREYHDLRTRLVEEQGIEPGERLQELYQGALSVRQAPIGGPTRSGAVPPARRDRQPILLAQLARDVPDFTGYAAELDQLVATATRAHEAGEAAVVQISGGPGVGKTAVAVRLARMVADLFPDGQLQLDLHGFGMQSTPLSSSGALRRMLTALAVPAPVPSDLEGRVAHYRSMVAGKRLLLLLDNAFSAEQVRPLLPGGESTLVIVTSRHALTGLTARDGAARVRLDPMREDDATDLFGRVLGRSMTAEERRGAQRLVRAFGRVPLAVRIAAARVGAAPSPEQAIAQIDPENPFDQLDVIADERSSLGTVFGWSYRALAEGPARTFRALGRLHRPAFTTRTTAAMLGVDRDVARGWLDALVDANLVGEPVDDHFQLNALTFAYARWLERRTSAAFWERRRVLREGAS